MEDNLFRYTFVYLYLCFYAYHMCVSAAALYIILVYIIIEFTCIDTYACILCYKHYSE